MLYHDFTDTDFVPFDFEKDIVLKQYLMYMYKTYFELCQNNTLEVCQDALEKRILVNFVKCIPYPLVFSGLL